MEIHDELNARMGSLLVGALGCFLLLLGWWQRRSSTSPATTLPLPPGTFGFLWVGETFKFFNALRVGDLSSFCRERTAKFRSKTFMTVLFFHKTAVVQGVAANRFIAAAENKQELGHWLPASVGTVLGEHIPLAKQGALHRRLRQIMASCLGPVAIRKLVGRADLITHRHFETCWKPQSQIFLLSLIKQNTFRIACSLLAGADDEALIAQIFDHFKIWSAGVISLPVDLPGTAFRRAKIARQMLVREIGKLMDSKLQHVQNAEDSNADLLCTMMRAKDENGSILNREELQDLIPFLLLVSFDTSSCSISFVLKYLEQNPDCYHRLVQEHEGIASQKNPGERLTWADIQNMKYTWAVIQETLCLRPLALGGSRQAKQDLSFDGYRIPQGWKMVFSMSSTHDDEQLFPEPHKFDPSRFDIEKLKEGNGPPPYAFIPFGIGPHSCPGGDFARMTMSIYLHHLALRKIRWTSIDPNENVHMQATLSLTKSYPAKVFIDTQP